MMLHTFKRFLLATAIALSLANPVFAFNEVVTSPVWIGRQVITTTRVYTPDNGTQFIDVACVGGGGGGGSAVATAATTISGGSGGGAGGGFRKRFSTGYSGVTFTIGTGGAAVNPGTATSVVIGGTTYTAGLGAAGSSGGAAVPPTFVGTGGAAGTGTNGDINVTGQAGTGVAYLSTGVLQGGVGGTAPFGLGIGGQSVTTGSTSAGAAGTGFGSGGSGAANVISQVATPAGGAGQPGVCLIDEWR